MGSCRDLVGKPGGTKKAVVRLDRHGLIKEKNRGVWSASGFENPMSGFQHTAGRPA
jgi:hypothetical protein